MPVVLQKFIETRTVQMALVGPRSNVVSPHGIVVDRRWPIEQTFSYGTDIKIIDYREVLEAFILSNQINKTRLRKFFLRTIFPKFERDMKQI